MKKEYFLFVIFFYYAAVHGQSWNLVWTDEFNSNSINTSNWTFEYGNSGWGNNELEYYTGRPDNAKVANGNLMIIAKKESYGGANYTSARMKTEGLQSFMYGKIEANIKLPSGKGLWPAFWMLGNDIPLVGWPKCGEIDIMEHVNTTTSVNGTAHWDINGVHKSSGGIYQGIDVTQYHLYSVEWSDQSINFFVDGSKYYSVPIQNNVNSTDEFHQPFFIILNLAVGGSWPGNPDSTTPFPDTMFVDYVRVYQLSTGVGEENSTVPSSFSLSQNYPNPFNPTTIIKFSVPSVGAEHVQPSHVLLKVYDALGREVATLVNEEKSPGNYEVKFDPGKSGQAGTNLASGVYFYQLVAGNFVETKKLVLMR